MPSAFNFSSSGTARSRLAWNTSDDFGAALSMRGLRFQRFVNVVAFPARLGVVDLHVERQGKLALRKDRIKIGGQRLEDVFAGFLSGREISPLAKTQHHVEKGEIRTSIGDGIVLATDGANTNASEREDACLNR